MVMKRAVLGAHHKANVLLSVLACPQPGMNLPDGWEHAMKDKQWLYATFVAIDANFHLKRRNVSTNEANPSLSKGWSYFVEEDDYKSYLAEHLGEAQEDWLQLVLALIDCTHHNLKRGNGVGDLQKGENNNSLKMLNVLYDIMCQWHKHIWSCMKSLPWSHHLDHVSKIIHFFIPKFHLPAHVAKCQSIFLFNFTRFVGRMDGEAPERVKWWFREQNPNDTMIPNPLETKATSVLIASGLDLEEEQERLLKGLRLQLVRCAPYPSMCPLISGGQRGSPTEVRGVPEDLVSVEFGGTPEGLCGDGVRLLWKSGVETEQRLDYPKVEPEK
ncbi:uncharacterized protein EDB91DRAFT_1339852 [Suillus paluster]|uniref:uncharacterized protein n=1 Tax=Suillus paluster TaxID=48578 RepID=UPI001B864AFF|nr:uncharacterized protein EDB91DRAFT_1339852 [Suillus paluster]KAG1725481.1 hypothetical protein EDB91DRAFT_1339852 [Suillus paluster]